MDAVGGEQRGPCEEHLLADTRGTEDRADHLRISFFRDGRNCMRHFPEHPTTPPACFIGICRTAWIWRSLHHWNGPPHGDDRQAIRIASPICPNWRTAIRVHRRWTCRRMDRGQVGAAC